METLIIDDYETLGKVRIHFILIVSWNVSHLEEFFLNACDSFNNTFERDLSILNYINNLVGILKYHETF